MTDSIGSHLTSTAAHEGPNGIGGWLAFACVVLIGTALLGGVSAYSALSNPAAADAVKIMGVFSGVVALISAFIGLGVWREKKYARWMAIVFFGLLFLFGLLELLGLSLSTDPQVNSFNVWWEVIRMVVVTGGLSVYFVRSERVKNTLTN